MTPRGRKAPGATEVDQTWSFRGSKSRNKVSVGEPAEGSLLKHCKGRLSWLFTGMCSPFFQSSSTCALFVGSFENGTSRGVPSIGLSMSSHTLECMSLNVFYRDLIDPLKTIQLSATDLLALASMKNAAKCDK